MKFLIAGLGNIGNEYAHTRHNIGFDVVNKFASAHGASFRVDRLAYVAEFKWKGKQVCCICPTTYMNLSGRAVKYWLDKEKIELNNLMVVVDELALPKERIRVRPTGSDGGHNGLRSIQESLGTTDYPKLRFGIGNDFPKGLQSDYVLGKWRKEEEALIQIKIDGAVEALDIFINRGINEAMNLVNNKVYSV